MKAGEYLKRARYLRRVLGFVWQSAPAVTVAKFVLLVIQGVTPILSLYLLKLTIDAVTTAALSPSPNFANVIWLVVAMGGAAFLGTICHSLSTLLGEVQEQAVTDYVVWRMHEKSVAVDLSHFEDPLYYDILHRAQQEAPFRPTRIINGVGQAGQSGVALIALVGLLLSLHWIIAIVLVAAALPGAIFKVRYSHRLYEWQRGITSAERETWYLHWLLTGETFAKELRLFDFGTHFIRRYRDIRRKLRRRRAQLIVGRSVGEVIGEGFSAITIFGALAYIAYEAMVRAITVGSLVMYFQALQAGQGYLRDILVSLAQLYEDTLFVENLFEFLDLKPQVVERAAPRAVAEVKWRGIRFENVSFAYSGADKPVLDNITISIPQGEHVAFVGANGAGKTTIVKLLCRLYDPTAGRILLDGTDLRDLDVASLRRRISAVFQDYARYDFTLRENIWLGNTVLEPNSSRIAHAARAGGLEGMIAKLPHGLETRLGKWFETEQELSVGQWQKVALARAFVRDAEIMILDEPTSALDPSAEYETFAKFRELATGRTTILISHRFSTVRMADCIYVLADSRIAESGSHHGLIRRGGEYARMFELQAANYR